MSVPNQQPPSTEQPPAGTAPPVSEQPPASGAPPVATPKPNGDGTATLNDGTVQVLSPGAYKRIKEEAKKRGAAAERAALEDRARALGFASLDDMLARAAPGSAAPAPVRASAAAPPARQAAPAAGAETTPPTPPEAPPRGAGRKAWEKYERARRQFDRDLQAYRERANRANARSRQLEAELEKQKTEQSLREMAMRAGVTDVDYAIHLFKGHLAGLTEDDIAKLDEQKWFEELRAKRPYLFSERVVPATTGTAGAAPPAPQPGAAAAAAARNGQFDARKATPQEVEQRLRKMGVSRPTV